MSSILKEGLTKIPIKNSNIKFNPPMINKDSIEFISFPKVKKASFNKEESGEIVEKDMDIQDVDIRSLKNMNSKELKQTANRLGIFNTKGGDEKVILSIIERLKYIEDYKTF